MDNKLEKVSLFANLRSYGSKAVSLEEIVRLIRYDTYVMQKTETYRHLATTISRDEANRRVKSERMEACSVGVLFNGTGRQPEHVEMFTGLALCDIDHIEPERMEEARRHIIDDPHTLICYRTISGQGLRIIFRYTRENMTGSLDGVPWRAAFLCGNRHYAALTGLEFDSQCGNYGRLSGLAHDEDVYFYPDAVPFVISDEMILAANFAEDTSANRGKPRKNMPAGSQTVTADEAATKVSQILTNRQIKYEPHHHHDYVLHACYLFNRFGVPEEELHEWAGAHWGDMDQRERDDLIRHCYKHDDEHGTWRMADKGRRHRENAMITIVEIRDWLTAHVEVIYNLVTDQTMYRVRSEKAPAATAGWQTVDERVLVSMRAQMAMDTDKRVLKSDVYDVIKSDFARLVHPVREYVEALPPWDGRDRVRDLADKVSVECPGDFEWAFHKWMVATVATWMDDAVSNHEVLTLIGSQGIYKTTFFRHLLPPELRDYFWENAHNSFSSKDDHLALAENCLVEIEEVDTASQRDLSELKALVTSESVKERRPYARFREEKHRMASFCATGNQQRFLSDDTGNRRWLCFAVSHIEDPRCWTLDYRQLYTQLRDEWRNGFCYWFTLDDQIRVERLNGPFRIESDEEQLIRTRLRPPQAGDTVKLMNAAMVCQLLNNGHVGYPLSSRRVSAAMRKMGFPDRHTRAGTFFSVYEIPFDQIQLHLAKDDDEQAPQREDPPPPVIQELPF